MTDKKIKKKPMEFFYDYCDIVTPSDTPGWPIKFVSKEEIEKEWPKRSTIKTYRKNRRTKTNDN